MEWRGTVSIDSLNCFDSVISIIDAPKFSIWGWNGDFIYVLACEIALLCLLFEWFWIPASNSALGVG